MQRLLYSMNSKKMNSRSHKISLIFIFILITLLSACSSQQTAQIFISVTIVADNQQQVFKVPAGSTVQTALDVSGITLNTLDRVEPPTYTLLSDQSIIRVVRVTESFEVEETVLPFEQQTVPNESLPAGQTLRVQAGSNGLQQITYRRVFENGIEISRSVFKVVTIQDPIPQIEMIGVQRPYTSLPIAGKLAYLTAGNAWIMEGNTGSRRPIVTTADLDGRIFSLSPDGQWLLYTRKPKAEQTNTINTLWVVSLNQEKPEPIDLKISNVVHYAGWFPNRSMTILYSTVEPRSTAPGWQANNDLHQLRFYESRRTQDTLLLEANAGGIYGWWGTSFAPSPNSEHIAYVRPDGIGLVDTEKGLMRPLADILPFQTRADWAWVPGLSWSPDSTTLYTVNHVAMSGLANSEASPLFHIAAIGLDNRPITQIALKSGMFAYPVTSPFQTEGRYQIAYLETIFDQSENSRYRLIVIDRDGSNRRILFPNEGMPGLDPQTVCWSPSAIPESPWWIAFVYQGNLWFSDPQTGKAQPITGDGLITNIDWK